MTAFDPGLAEEAFEDDREGLAAFFESVLSSMQSGLARVREAMAAGDTTAIRAAAHAVKGSSGHLGATEVGRHAARIEDAARAGRIEDLQTVDALERAVTALRQTVEDYLKKRSASA